jgi:enoyl-CoA hydratase/carnithine racemase
VEYEAIRFEREDSVAILTLNRPERMNAWTGAMAVELSHALGVCNSDDAVRVIVLTGAGRAFCAGADLGGGGDTFGDFVERRESKREPAPIHPTSRAATLNSGYPVEGSRTPWWGRPLAN